MAKTERKKVWADRPLLGVTLILVLANYLDRHQSQIKDFVKGFLPLMGLIGGVCGLIVVEPDLGTPILLVGVGFILVFLAGARWRHLLAAAAVSLVPLYFLLF